MCFAKDLLRHIGCCNSEQHSNHTLLGITIQSVVKQGHAKAKVALIDTCSRSA